MRPTGLDVRCSREPLGEPVGVLRVRLAAERERLDALDELEGVERREAAAHVAEGLDAREQDEDGVGRVDAEDGWSAKTPPWYDGCLSAMIGNLHEPSAFVTRQSKLEPSTMMPPIEVPWPPIHLVADSTMMSAPKESGLHV